MPTGIVAQLMGHKPERNRGEALHTAGTRLAHLSHVKIESWILEQAGIEFMPVQAGLHVINRA